MAEMSGHAMRTLTQHVWADFNRDTLLITWRWEVLDCGCVILGSIADSRSEAKARAEEAIEYFNTIRRQYAA
jgi:hypothetical protein